VVVVFVVVVVVVRGEERETEKRMLHSVVLRKAGSNRGAKLESEGCVACVGDWKMRCCPDRIGRRFRCCSCWLLYGLGALAGVEGGWFGTGTGARKETTGPGTRCRKPRE
jgi:hypothetical protein